MQSARFSSGDCLDGQTDGSNRIESIRQGWLVGWLVIYGTKETHNGGLFAREIMFFGRLRYDGRIGSMEYGVWNSCLCCEGRGGLYLVLVMNGR